MAQELNEKVVSLMEETAVPGVVVGILNQGQTHIASFGVTNIDHPLPVTADTLFQIGSITKTFTATLMMRLVEQGLLDLDAPLTTYLPDFRVQDETAVSQITPRHLVSHIAGWVGDHFVDTGSGANANQLYAATMAGLPQLAPVGKLFSYNNASFSLAGHLIETLMGQSYEAAMQAELFDPLDMDHAYFYAGDVMTHRFAVGHRVTPDGPVVQGPWPLPRAVHAAGAICCSAGNLLRYAAFHLNNGKAESGQQLLAAEAVEQMRTPQRPVGDMMEAIGLSWFLDRVDGVWTASHGGATVGQLSQLVLVPERNFAFSIMTNADYGRVFNKELSGWILAHYLGLESEKVEPMATSAEMLAEIVGRYERPFQDLDLTVENGRLHLAVTFKQSFPNPDTPVPPPLPPMPLELISPNCFRVLDGPMKHQLVSIIHDDDGVIGWIRYGGRIHRRA
ncbi:MAG: serine hydrolase domain-containing protein [Chloroflexota bacterium]